MSESVPVVIGRASDEPTERVSEVAGSGEVLGHAAASMLRHLLAVLDREDRLESGTGQAVANMAGDQSALRDAVSATVLRSLRMACDPVAFRMLVELDDGAGRRPVDLAKATGVSALTVAEMVSDLVSAGLAAKLPEAGQVTGTPAGAAVVSLVRSATAAGAVELGAAT